VKVDKGNAMVIIPTSLLHQKIHTFLQKNHMQQLLKDPTDMYQKQIQQAIQHCPLIDKSHRRFVTQMKPTAPLLNVSIKMHKPDRPIRPVINNIPAPSYKLAKFLNRKLTHMLALPHTFTVTNSLELARELTQLQIAATHKTVTFDISDLYVNLPTTELTTTTKFWLQRILTPPTIIQQLITLVTIVLRQNYFQFDNRYYKPPTGIAMGSPLSTTMAEIYLQYIEEMFIKHWLETREIIFYRRYVDILILFDTTKTNEHTIQNFMN
jgi:hypothetical protein